ncbi:ATP-binding protein [Neobacillus cucumis]|uniref:ATP-binding protein n=1 Tax=Neobacillus cucumis TaxID=1740721 RepID=UPI002E214491|nr:ATP-binding protein [Neobacillus cucumis]
MKSVNLISLLNAANDLSSSIFKLYLENFSVKVKANELKDIGSLVNQLLTHSRHPYIYDGFYCGYSISQISKEFDLLRFGISNVINIELKTENTGDRMKEQLLKNKYYLSFIGKQVLSFTFVAEEETLYYLDNNENLIKTEFSFLISNLIEQELESIDDIDKKFDPSNYLVSPFNSTEAFLEGRYFLTDHQVNIKKEILKLNSTNGPCYISIEGSAGTGKTLLTYDIAKEYINDSKKVLIFHCGSLNSGHRKLRDNYSWIISNIKDHDSYTLSKYDLIIIDEAQRVYKEQLEKFLNDMNSTNIKCIFSYDSQQCLASWEMDRKIPEFIKNQVSPQHFKLSDKIRTNKEIASFIKNLFDLSKRNPNQVYCNVNVQYFSSSKDAKKYMDALKYDGWKVINYTPSKYTRYPYENYQNSLDETAHHVIGQEFDNVVAVLDPHFYYAKNGKLSTRGYTSKPYYHPTKMLYQIVTRTRKKLIVIIIKNEVVLDQCLKILKIN